MNVYLDTSALVKHYIEEDGSDTVNDHTDRATIIATSRIAYAEALSAFVRCKDEKVLSKNNYDKCITCFKFDWEMYFVIEASEKVIRIGGDLIEKHSIRGFNSIHLASAMVLRKEINQSINFMCWDNRLLEAAKKEGFRTWPK
ncbi:type II toxin-antitoxin system VapC family toxin [Actinomycetota bacterium]